MIKFINFSGLINIAAGILLLAYWYLYAILMPYAKLDTTLAILVENRNWVMVNTLGVIGSLAGLVGLLGIYMKTAEVIKNAGMAGFLLAFIGTILFTATMIWDTVLWPILVKHDASILDFSGPIYTSKTFLPFFILAGILYSAGYLIMGISMAKSGVNPYWGSIAIAAGAPLFGLGSAVGKLQVYPRTLGITLLCVGLIWFGILMLQQRSI